MVTKNTDTRWNSQFLYPRIFNNVNVGLRNFYYTFISIWHYKISLHIATGLNINELLLSYPDYDHNMNSFWDSCLPFHFKFCINGGRLPMISALQFTMSWIFSYTFKIAIKRQRSMFNHFNHYCAVIHNNDIQRWEW